MKDANIDRRKERVIRRMVIEAELFDLVDEIREANRMTKGAVDALSFVANNLAGVPCVPRTARTFAQARA